MNTKAQAIIEDLYQVPEDGKAELVNGELVLMAATGFMPGRASGEIYVSLRDYERLTKTQYFSVKNQAVLIMEKMSGWC